jgi:hypothetical protein
VHVAMTVISIRCVLGVSGSAIKGVRLFQLPLSPPDGDAGTADVLLASVGYDQRLSVWSVSNTTTSPETEDEAESMSDDGVISIPCHLEIYSNSKRKYDENESSAALLAEEMDEEGDGQCTEATTVPVHFTREHIQISSNHASEQGSSPLTWLGGSVVNIGDVNGIALLTNGGVEMIGVVGEGIQVFQRNQ